MYITKKKENLILVLNNKKKTCTSVRQYRLVHPSWATLKLFIQAERLEHKLGRVNSVLSSNLNF